MSEERPLKKTKNSDTDAHHVVDGGSVSSNLSNIVEQRTILAVEVEAKCKRENLIRAFKQFGNVTSNYWKQAEGTGTFGLVAMDDCDPKAILEKAEIFDLLGVKKIRQIDSTCNSHIREVEGSVIASDDEDIERLLCPKIVDIKEVVVERQAKRGHAKSYMDVAAYIMEVGRVLLNSTNEKCVQLQNQLSEEIVAALQMKERLTERMQYEEKMSRLVSSLQIENSKITQSSSIKIQELKATIDEKEAEIEVLNAKLFKVEGQIVDCIDSCDTCNGDDDITADVHGDDSVPRGSDADVNGNTDGEDDEHVHGDSSYVHSNKLSENKLNMPRTESEAVSSVAAHVSSDVKVCSTVDDITSYASEDGTKKNVLLITTEWLPRHVDSSIPFVNRQVGIKLADEKHTVYCMVWDSTSEDKEDAEKYGVQLILPSINDKLSESGKTPSIDWYINHSSYFPDLKNIQPINVVIGHFGLQNESTAQAACEIKGELFDDARLVTFVHVIPWDLRSEGYINSEQAMVNEINQCAEKSYLVVALGPRVHEFLAQLKGLWGSTTVTLMEYLPAPPDVGSYDSSVDIRKKSITILAIVRNPKSMTSLYAIAVALCNIAENNNYVHPTTTLRVHLHIPKNADDKGTWKDYETQLRKKLRDSTDQHLDISVFSSVDIKAFMDLFYQCTLVVDGDVRKPFSIPGLLCLASAKPVLFTTNCGLAMLLNSESQEFHDADRVTVDVGISESTESGARKWEEKIKKLWPNCSDDKYGAKLQRVSHDLQCSLLKSAKKGKIYESQRLFLYHVNNIHFDG